MARSGYKSSTFTYEGKRYYCYAPTQREADKKAAAKLALMEANVRQITGNTTVREWSQEWLTTYKSGSVSDSWYKQVESIVNNKIVPVIGDMRLRDVKPLHITKLYNTQLGKSASNMHKVCLVTRQIFDSAEENDLIDKDPSKRVKKPVTGSDSGYRTITDFERELTLRTAEKHPESGLFFLIMLYCGCRPQEVSRLTMGDYDKENRILRVNKARKKDGSTGKPKSSAGNREIPVPDELAVYLDRIKKKKNELIITSAEGKPLTITSQRRMWKKFKRQMEIENGAKLFRLQIVDPVLPDDLVPYCYRHTYCTDLQDAGVPVTVAKVLMGHSDISVTANIYTHHSKDSFEDAREKINRHNKGKKKG